MKAQLVLISGELRYKETDIVSSFNGVRLVELTDDIHYIFKNLKTGKLFTITVPKGFITDFGTIPKFAQCLVNPKGRGKLAFIVHDWLCVTAMLPRSDADSILYASMTYCNVDLHQRVIAYLGVRAYALIIKRVMDVKMVDMLSTLDAKFIKRK